MDFQRIEIPELRAQSWEWPLQVGVEKSSDFLKIDFSEQPYFVPRFTNLNKFGIASQSKKHFNIMIFDSFKDAQQKLTNNKNATADILIIRENENFFSAEANLKATDELSEEWARQMNAGGIYFIRDNHPIQDWYSEVLRELSHNKGFEEAVTSVKESLLRSYITPNLNEETQLSNYITKFTTDVISGPLFEIESEEFDLTDLDATPFPVDFRNKPGAKKSTILFQSNAHHLNFDAEKDSASDFAEYVKAIKNLEKSEQKKNVENEQPSVTTTPDAGAEPDSPRYLRAMMEEEDTSLPVNDYLLPDQKYRLLISIGYKISGWTVPDEQISVEDIFKDPSLRNVNIDLIVRTNISSKPVLKKIILPRKGESNTVSLDVLAESENFIFEADIYAYYQAKLLQQVRYRIAIARPQDAPLLPEAESKSIVVLRKDLGSVTDSAPFSASLSLLETDTKRSDYPVRDTHGQESADLPYKSDINPIRGIIGQEPVHLQYNSSMEYEVNQIKTLLERGVENEYNEHFKSEENVDLLMNLAKHGYLLFTGYLNELPLDGPLQLLSNSREYLPLDFAYTRKPPGAGSSMCVHAKDALIDGKCCGHFEDTADQYNVLCPFGFWGLKYIVERHQLPRTTDKDADDFILKFEPDSNRKTLQVLNKTQYACTMRVNADVPESYSLIQKALVQNSSSLPNEVKSWRDWVPSVTATAPDTIVLVVHVEEDPNSLIRKLEIADKDFLEQLQFDERYLNTTKGGPLPLVILIGCETSNTNAYLFDAVNYIQRKGAAIVLSNFTSITGEMAVRIVTLLVGILRKNTGTELRFGEALLRIRQLLLAEGMMIGLTLLAHGDADWKIKV